VRPPNPLMGHSRQAKEILKKKVIKFHGVLTPNPQRGIAVKLRKII